MAFACACRPPVAAVLVAALLGACTGEHSILSPAGPQASLIADLTLVLTAMSVAVCAIVVIVLAFALLRRRDRPEDATRAGVGAGRTDVRDGRGRALVVLGGVVLPLVLLPVAWALSLPAMRAIAEPATPAELTVEVTARQWSYDVAYPDSGRSLVDEIRIPAGEPVRLRLTSADVIHSFWVPRLAGKHDMIPGVVHEVWIQADEPGTYRGRCAEFCGIGHARMELRVVAEERAAFEAWALRR